MRENRIFSITALTVFLTVGSARFSIGQQTTPTVADTVATRNLAVGPQYDTAHVYVAPEDFDKFVASLLATFGGTASKKAATTVTPTPSRTMWQAVSTPVGLLS